MPPLDSPPLDSPNICRSQPQQSPSHQVNKGHQCPVGAVHSHNRARSLTICSPDPPGTAMPGSAGWRRHLYKLGRRPGSLLRRLPSSCHTDVTRQPKRQHKSLRIRGPCRQGSRAPAFQALLAVPSTLVGGHRPSHTRQMHSATRPLQRCIVTVSQLDS